MKEIDMMFAKTPDEISVMIMKQVRKRRKEGKLAQEQLSRKAEVSLGSSKRFETSDEISLRSLVRLTIALEREDDFFSLFTKKQYSFIQEILNENI